MQSKYLMTDFVSTLRSQLLPVCTLRKLAAVLSDAKCLSCFLSAVWELVKALV